MKQILIKITLLTFVASCLGANQDDKVDYLPDMGNFTDFSLYSGYLHARNTGRYLHYMFAESQKDPSKDPLVIWFNGGPGCSSMLGFLQEHGPYVNEDEENNFHLNQYSWNKEANMLYIESPAGVGYSFCDDDGTLCDFDDFNSSSDNLDALLDFYNKFPEYKNHELYLSGESYAGVYVPFLAWRIHNHNLLVNQSMKNSSLFTINMKGWMVGNPVTNWKWDGDPTYVEMGLTHGLYGMDFHELLKENHCDFLWEDIAPNDTDICQGLYEQFGKYTQYINIYDIYRKCLDCGVPEGQLKAGGIGHAMVGGQLKTYKKYFTSKQYTPWLYQSKMAKLGLPVQILKAEYFTDWINRPDVRQLLHIPNEVQGWNQCSDTLNYYSTFNASEWIYHQLRNHYRIMVYSGSTDGAVPTRGSRLWITNTGWEVQEKWRPYYVNDQLGGFIEQREGFTFATIHGTGHMAPQWKREETYYLIFNWLLGREI